MAVTSAHTHQVYDTDKHFTIDPITKQISTLCPKVVLPQHSKNSERFTFEIPKTVEGHDMSACNLVEIHYQNIEAANPENVSVGIYKVEDLQADGDLVTGSWLIDDDATYYVGGLMFAMHFACVATDGTVEYDMPTLSYSDITIGKTIWNSEIIAKKYPHIIARFEARMLALEQGGGRVTPQMFGAVADGETDDTDAVQAALDTGGMIYFPAGRYKVTRQLTALKSCKISMCKPYPCTWQGDYPLTSADNWMGARIETYSTDGYGLLIGDGVEVDGLYMRAMDTFVGVLFKFDGSLGCATYPSQVRLSRIRLDCNSIYTVPEAMFDFVPHGSYFGILDDITIGSLRGRQFCEYGFRSVMTTTDTNWGNSMRIRNLCVDLLADYSIYIEGGAKGAANWVLEHPTVQAYPYKPDQADYLYRTGHINLVTLKNMQDVLILGGCLWDMHMATMVGAPILTENTTHISCFGCDKWFEAVETVLTGKLQNAADNLNISTLTMSVSGVQETGANRLKLSDGTNEQSVDIPSVSVSDEQLDNSIAKWFDENAAPMPTVGRNKFNPMDNETVNGYFYAGNGGYEAADSMTTSHFIEAKFGDVIRIGRSGSLVAAYHFHLYDADKNWLGCMATSDSAAARTIEVENTAYIRVCWTSGTFAYADRATAEICVTVNNTNIVYEPYKVTYEGGIGSYIVLQSPGGTQFRLSVGDDGAVTAVPINSDGTGSEPDNSIEWKISDRTAVTVVYATPTAPRTIEFDTYLLGISNGGYWNGEVSAPVVTLTGEDFTMTTCTNGYGVGVPYELKAGKTYRISFDADAAFGLFVSYYDEEGVFVTSETIVTEGSPAGSYSKEFAAKDYAYPVLFFRGEKEVPVTFSNIVLEGVTNEA